MPSNARHSKATPRWGTPSDLVDRAKRCMGGIDLDPCSEDTFQAVVQASKYYSLEDRGEDALTLPWSEKVFCNPPGLLVKEFWNRALSQDIEQMIWIGFSIEQFATLQDSPLHPLDFSTCILRKRIAFTRHDGYRGSPSHSNYITGVNVFPDSFEREFDGLGKIIHGRFVLIPEVQRSVGGFT